MSQQELWVCHLGQIGYTEALAIQEQLRDRRQADEIPDVLLLLEHDAVYTRGRRSEAGELPFKEGWYRERGIEICDTNRGGKVTYHGPGQLVGYPIVRIDDVVAFVRTIERAVIAALAQEGIESRAREGLTGIWADDQKIGSIGLHVSRGVTTHGFSVNVECDLEPFSWIVPCGLGGVEMTSVAVETETVDIARFRREIAQTFANEFDRSPVEVGPDALAIAIPSNV